MAGIRNKNRHAVTENLDIVRYLGLPVLPVSFPVKFTAPVVDQPEPRVAIVPLSRRTNKNWPLPSFLETARQLQKEFKASIFLFGSKADQAVCEQMCEVLSAPPGAGTVVNLAGQTSLVEMGGWFSQMNLVLVNDSGPLHLAVAQGIPVVTMFGPTDPKRTGPYGDGHYVLRSDISCSPCFDKHCHLPRVDCMAGITPEQVMGAIRGILNPPKAGL